MKKPSMRIYFRGEEVRYRVYTIRWYGSKVHYDGPSASLAADLFYIVSKGQYV